MINKIKEMYPNYLMLIKIFGKFFNVLTNSQINPENFRKSRFKIHMKCISK